MSEVRINLPTKVRGSLYVVTALGTPVVVYAVAKGWIGDLELTLWAAEVTAVNIMAGLNTTVGSSK